MKLIFLIFVLIFAVSCNDHKEIINDEDFDSVDDEISDYDAETVTPACADEWEQVDIADDVGELFDFEIIKKTGNWKFEKEDDFEKFVVDRNFFPFHVSEDGTIFANGGGGTNEVEEGVSFLQILKPDGTLVEYVAVFEKGEELVIGNNKTNINLTSTAVYYEKTEEIYITINMRSKIKDETTGEYIVKPFVAVMNKEGDFSYKSWKFDGNSICTFPKKEDGKIFLTCINWSSLSEIYAQSGGTNAEMIIIDGTSVYRKIVLSESDDYAFSLSSDSEKLYAYFRSQGDQKYDMIYETNKKDLCFEGYDYLHYFLTDYFIIKYGMQPSLLGKYSSFSFFSGYYQEWISSEEENWLSTKAALYINFNKKEVLLSFGSNAGLQIVGEEMVANYALPGDVFVDGNEVYLTGVSSFDIEDKGRDWITEEVLEVADQPEQPFIAVVNMETMEVHIKQLFTEFNENRYGFIYVNNDDIYYESHGVIPDSNGNTGRVLYRIPKSWLINEDSIAKNTRVWVKEKKPLESVGKVLTVSCGRSHTCVLNENKQAICWGDNSNGQLGDTVGMISKDDPLKITSPYPDLIEMDGNLSGKKVTGVDTFSKHTCAVTDAGVLYCWGDDSFETIGAPTPGNNFTYYPLPVKTDGVLKDKKIADVAPGASHTCAVDENGKGYCWGQNLLGSAGCGLEDQIIHEPVEVDMTGALKDKKILEISSGSGHTCTIADDGWIYCWGSNDTGQLGDGNGGHSGGIGELGDMSRVPVKAETGELKFKTVSSGASHTCALSEDGAVYCFGNNSKGQLGDSTTEMRLVPVKVDSDMVFKSVSAGFEHSCAVDDAGDAYCWGSNITGQLGNGTKEDSLIPVKVAFDEGIKIKSISCGHRHTCALDEEGKVYCWGWNNSGQLGNGTYDDSGLPVEIRVKE